MILPASILFMLLGGSLYIATARNLLQTQRVRAKIEGANAARVKLQLAAQRWRRR